MLRANAVAPRADGQAILRTVEARSELSDRDRCLSSNPKSLGYATVDQPDRARGRRVKLRVDRHRSEPYRRNDTRNQSPQESSDGSAQISEGSGNRAVAERSRAGAHGACPTRRDRPGRGDRQRHTDTCVRALTVTAPHVVVARRMSPREVLGVVPCWRGPVARGACRVVCTHARRAGTRL
jgi:hypothetical protein